MVKKEMAWAVDTVSEGDAVTNYAHQAMALMFGATATRFRAAADSSSMAIGGASHTAAGCKE